MELTHVDSRGQARMVDVSDKDVTGREAVARGRVRVRPEALQLVKEGQVAKGDVLGVARLAGIMAAKETSRLIPLCHPLPLTAVAVEVRVDAVAGVIEVQSRVKTTGRTGVEMEALTAVSVACLAVYDMLKAVDRGMVIEDVRLVEKSGGRSGHYLREGEEVWEG
ncbi:MAG: cyclic pyranopterin monophosphate synthase MoaC [Clostridia bacterium]|nr:MAG: cyclic pyranopterin monophosphate synthase MoaC [Clostridia bacterium]